MSDEWILNTVDEMQESSDEEIKVLGEVLEDEFFAGNVTKELIIVQNAEQNEKTVVDSLTEPGLEIDRVHIVKLEEVIE